MASTFEPKHPVTVDSFDDGSFAARNYRFIDSSPVGTARRAEDGTVFLDGYLLEFSDPENADGHLRDGNSLYQREERAIWRLFQQHGEAFVDFISGVFNVCVYNIDHVILANCRHGARHIYYVLNSQYFAFATEAKALLAIEGARKTVNQRAVYNLFNFGYLSGCETMFEEIRLLDQGSILNVGTESQRQCKYWQYEYSNTTNRETFDDLVGETRYLLAKAVGKYSDRFSHLGVPLSGGLDSRTILSYASQQEDPVPVFHCAWYAHEERIAKNLCLLNRGEWYRFDPLEFDYGTIMEEGIERSGGNTHCHQFWFLPIAQKIGEAGLAKMLLDGYLMDVFLGDTFLVLPAKNEYNTEEKMAIINGMWRRCKPIFVKRSFLPEFYSEYEQTNRDSISSEMSKIDEPHISNFVQRFSFANRSNRYSVALPNIQRQYVEYGYPGLDYEITDLYLRLPPEYKRGAGFYRAIIQREFPEAAAIGWAKTGKVAGSAEVVD